MSSTAPSQFVWYELMTTDPASALDFYRHVMGWNTEDAGIPGTDYTLLMVGTTSIGGVVQLPERVAAGGARPGWLGYVGVDDVDAKAREFLEAGGTLHHGPEDIPGIGRFAFVADPHGAMLVLFKGQSDEPPAMPAPMTPGHVGWHELHAGDQASAFEFYSRQFGWTRTEAMDMGPMGVYQLFAAGGLAIGGMMTKTSDMPAPMWVYYFAVDDIDAATARVTEKGGQVINGPMEVPGGAWVINALDPQHAMFALVGMRKQG